MVTPYDVGPWFGAVWPANVDEERPLPAVVSEQSVVLEGVEPLPPPPVIHPIAERGRQSVWRSQPRERLDRLTP